MLTRLTSVSRMCTLSCVCSRMKDRKVCRRAGSGMERRNRSRYAVVVITSSTVSYTHTHTHTQNQCKRCVQTAAKCLQASKEANNLLQDSEGGLKDLDFYADLSELRNLFRMSGVFEALTPGLRC